MTSRNMMVKNDSSRNRYPGLVSFEETQSSLFFGRSREKQDLINLVLSQQVTVLYAKSGIGKSSLINAGLIPLFAEKNLYPVRVRFQQTDSTLTPQQIFIATLKENKSLAAKAAKNESQLEHFIDLLISPESFGLGEEERAAIPGAAPASAAGGTDAIVIHSGRILFDKGKPRIWETVKVAEFPGGKTPIFLFDQFEEFFNFCEADRKDFLFELSELLHTQPPNRIVNWLGSIPYGERTEEHLKWIVQPQVKCMFIIRDDKLAELDALSSFAPLILKNRYKLNPLSYENAREALEKPAQLDGAQFRTKPFVFDELTLNKILFKLGGVEDSRIAACKEADSPEVQANRKFINLNGVDGSQLQKICNHIEQRVAELQQSSGPLVVINDAILDPQKGIEQTLNNFYAEQLKTLGGRRDRRLARKIIENNLVAGHTRASVTKDQMLSLTNHDTALISKMMDSRLIKQEFTHLGETYEISHDTLLKSILKAKEKAAEQHKIRRIYAMLFSVIVVVAGSGLLYSYTKEQEYQLIEQDYEYSKSKNLQDSGKIKVLTRNYENLKQSSGGAGKSKSVIRGLRDSLAMQHELIDKLHLEMMQLDSANTALQLAGLRREEAVRGNERAFLRSAIGVASGVPGLKHLLEQRLFALSRMPFNAPYPARRALEQQLAEQQKGLRLLRRQIKD